MRKTDIFPNAQFVTSSEPCVAPRFRNTFFLQQKQKTIITVCGLGVFRLYINGQKVSDDIFAPVTSFYHPYDNCHCTVNFGEELSGRIYCMQYDITELVKEGKNSVCAVVAPGWYGLYNDCCVFCYEISSENETFFSDKTVRWNDSPITEYRLTRGEKQDYTKDNFDGRWLLPDYDDSTWKCAVETVLPDTEYFIQDCPNDKIIRSVPVKKIFEGEDYFVYDIGENITGWPVFKCRTRGQKISLTVSEERTEEGDIHEKWDQNQTLETICDGTDREYHLLFTWHGFRYVKISKEAELLRCDVIHTDISFSSDFHCENDVLNWLFTAFERTQLCNMHQGIPSDCPHLERRGYTGDGQLVSETAMLLMDGRKFYAKWIEDIFDCQDKNSGHVQYTAPYDYCGGGPGGWGCAIAEVPYMYYKVYGDLEPFKKCFDHTLRYFDYLDAHSENDLVISDQPGLWCLGDWCAPQEKHGSRPDIPEPFVNNYFYIRTIDRLLELCEKVGRENDRENLLALRKRKVDALCKAYFDPTTGDFAENKNSANAFALDIGLGDERTLQNLVKNVRTKPLDTGIFGTELVPKILLQNGYFDETIKFLTATEYPSFGFMFKSGATTLWEEWKNPRSMSHPMFGAVVKYLFYYILGIRRASDAGFDKILIAPQINKVTGSAEGFITTQKGKISVSVTPDILRITLPKDVDAEVRFDGKTEIIRY